MKVVYARQPLPTRVERSIFLAGPTPRRPEVSSWRPEALRVLSQLGFDGHVYVPEDEQGGMHGEYAAQLDWETKGLQRADAIVFWLARSMPDMPALTSNDEWGHWKSSGKCVLGTPPDAASVRYQQAYADEHGIPRASTLRDTLQLAMERVGAGALRQGAQCALPAHVWTFPAFASWYARLCAAGNELVDARVDWCTWVAGKPFLCALWVDVFVTAERRHKRNEWVVLRPDVASNVVLWRHPHDPLQSRVVLVREFRSAAAGGLVELAGGSSHDARALPAVVAAEELREELGLTPATMPVPLGPQPRQLAPTLLSHCAAAFVVTVDEATVGRFEELEVARYRRCVAQPRPNPCFHRSAPASRLVLSRTRNERRW